MFKILIPVWYFFFVEGEEVKIGEFNGVSEQLDLSRGEPIKWQGQRPPQDRTLTLIEPTRIDLKVYALLASFSTFGIIMAIIFLAINITYRNQRSVSFYLFFQSKREC
jgi:gamma-aminobutyric acid type B receptor